MDHIQEKIGFREQETTMFYLEYTGDIKMLNPIDEEINVIRFIEKAKVLEVLSHEDTRNFFTNYFIT
ncbi:hypothetical protein [Alkalihalobacillus sp. TS-13]|uniref:hypothetical protein n=1 Tax=Alkalihalobacillus sp. TS-13 TaxID=2842455 RepID=UPI001C86B34A|nr:hypothetical protein [Alkalihalobacillus sp. TS-13]